MDEEFEWAFSPTDGEKLERANAKLASLRQQVKIAREALIAIAEDFGDYPTEKHRHLGDQPWFHMASEQSDIARAALKLMA